MNPTPSQEALLAVHALENLTRIWLKADEETEAAQIIDEQFVSLRARAELAGELADALDAMDVLATMEGWNTPLFSPQFGEALRPARTVLAKYRAMAGKQEEEKL